MSAPALAASAYALPASPLPWGVTPASVRSGAGTEWAVALTPGGAVAFGVALPALLLVASAMLIYRMERDVALPGQPVWLSAALSGAVTVGAPLVWLGWHAPDVAGAPLWALIAAAFTAVFANAAVLWRAGALGTAVAAGAAAGATALAVVVAAAGQRLLPVDTAPGWIIVAFFVGGVAVALGGAITALAQARRRWAGPRADSCADAGVAGEGASSSEPEPGA